ncbi:MAG: hypothetical protein KKE94_03185, partial [Gammaproteobacteria bacterium]|nr:hypothetical protein [Gammaproteobacteria bacterium]
DLMKAAALLLPFTMLLCSCVEDITADDSTTFDYLQRGETALSPEKQIQLIDSQSSYDDIYYQLLGQSAAPQTLDFSQYQVLLVMAGSAHYTFEQKVATIQGLSDRVVLELYTEYAGPSCVVPAVQQQRWMLVLLPRVMKPLLITEQASVRRC